MLDQARNKGDHHLHWNINKCKIKGTFDIINNISEHITLVQLMDTVGIVNHTVSIDGNWIFDSNDDKELPFAK